MTQLQHPLVYITFNHPLVYITVRLLVWLPYVCFKPQQSLKKDIFPSNINNLYLLPVSVHEHLVLYSKEEFEDTRWVIRIRQLSASLSAWHSWYIFQFTDHLNLKFSRQNIWYVCLLKPKTVTAILHTYLPYCTHICHTTHILVILPTYLSYCTHICHTAHIFVILHTFLPYCTHIAILHTYVPYRTYICHIAHIFVILHIYLTYCTHIAILHTYLTCCTHICHTAHLIAILHTYLQYCTHIYLNTDFAWHRFCFNDSEKAFIDSLKIAKKRTLNKSMWAKRPKVLHRVTKICR